ncbi:MAG: hypothetical protein ABJE66_07425 [Deltaproteobacteria bacterium]
MQLIWSLIVAWAMVASAAPHGPRDHAHHTGISVAPAFRHPVRQREIPVVLGPFLAPDRTELVSPSAIAIVRSTPPPTIALDRTESTARARAPPVA